MLLRKIHCTLSVFLLSAMTLVSTGCDSHSRPVPDYDENTKVIALTFDDGPNTNTTVEILDILEKYGVVASFFVIGNNVTEETAPIVKRAYDMGCEINNHSLTHSNMISFSEEELLSEISQTSDKVEEITGEPTHFFRPPYIAVDGDMFTTIDLPFICGYGVDDYSNKVSADQRYEGVMEAADDGAIILLHDMYGNSMTVEAVDRLIPDLLEQGYTFVTVSQLFDAKNVEPKSGIVYTFAEQTGMYQ